VAAARDGRALLEVRDDEGAEFTLLAGAAAAIAGDRVSFYHDGRTAAGVPRSPRFMRRRENF
jgi:hypothetical protein